MTAKTMAEVLAEHWFSPADYAYCRCGADMSPGKPVGAHEALAAHQAAALSAAGFGLVADAKAEAWDEGFDRGFYDPLAGSDRDASESLAHNPYRNPS